MRKWYEIQFVTIATLNIIIFIFTMAASIRSEREFLYIKDTFTVSISLLALSGILMILFDMYQPKSK